MVNDLKHARGPLMGFVMVGLVWGSFAGLVPAIKATAGLSDAGLGNGLLLGAFFAFSAMMCAPALERIFARSIMPVFALLMTLAFLAVSVSGNWLGFAIGIGLAALGTGTLDVAMNARISVIENQRARPLMNFAHGVFSLSYAVSALASGLAREAGMTPFDTFAVISGINLAGIVILVYAPEPVEEKSENKGPARLFSIPFIGLIGGILMIAFMAEQAAEGWSALHLERAHSAGAAQSAMAPAILGLTMAIGRFGGQALAMWFSEAAVIRGGALLALLGTIVAAWSGSLMLGYFGFALLGLGVSVIVPMGFAWVGRHAPKGQKAYSISRVAGVGYFGFFIGPPMMGFLAEAFGLTISFTVLAGLVAIMPLILLPLALGREQNLPGR